MNTKKANKRARHNSICVTLTDEERAIIEKAAYDARLTMTAFVRNTVLDILEKEKN